MPWKAGQAPIQPIVYLRCCKMTEEYGSSKICRHMTHGNHVRIGKKHNVLWNLYELGFSTMNLGLFFHNMAFL